MLLGGYVAKIRESGGMVAGTEFCREDDVSLPVLHEILRAITIVAT